MFFEKLFTILVTEWWWYGAAIAHIGLVVMYKTWKNWGTMQWFQENGLFRSPGGAIATALPFFELLSFGVLISLIPTPASLLAAGLVAHMLRVRVLLLLLFGLPALWCRIFKGQVRVVCMDNRLNSQAAGTGRLVANHTGVCGAFVTLTLAGFMPGLVLVTLIMALGFDVSLSGVWLFAIPWLFIFAKHFRFIPEVIPDKWQLLTESLGLWFNGLVFGAQTQIQHISKTHAK